MPRGARLDLAGIEQLWIRGDQGIPRPVARSLMEGRVTYREFDDMAKRAFLTEALIEARYPNGVAVAREAQLDGDDDLDE